MKQSFGENNRQQISNTASTVPSLEAAAVKNMITIW
jgi:hypothetical protein